MRKGTAMSPRGIISPYLSSVSSSQKMGLLPWIWFSCVMFLKTLMKVCCFSKYRGLFALRIICSRVFLNCEWTSPVQLLCSQELECPLRTTTGLYYTYMYAIFSEGGASNKMNNPCWFFAEVLSPFLLLE